MSNGNSNALWSALQQGPIGAATPPKDVDPGTLWAKLNEDPRPTRIVPFPRKGADGKPVGEVAIWVLTQEEQMICASAAERFAKERVKDGKKSDIGYETVYSQQSVVELLYRACRRVDDVKMSAFPSPSLIRERLTTDECSVLFEHYLSVQLEFGPLVSMLDKDEYEAWVTRIAEGGLAASPFVLISSEMQRLLAYFMACQIRELKTGGSSAGTPPSTPHPSVEPDAIPSAEE